MPSLHRLPFIQTSANKGCDNRCLMRVTAVGKSVAGCWKYNGGLMVNCLGPLGLCLMKIASRCLPGPSSIGFQGYTKSQDQPLRFTAPCHVLRNRISNFCFICASRKGNGCGTHAWGINCGSNYLNLLRYAENRKYLLYLALGRVCHERDQARAPVSHMSSASLTTLQPSYQRP